jgi:protein-disulfide isomerase
MFSKTKIPLRFCAIALLIAAACGSVRSVAAQSSAPAGPAPQVSADQARVMESTERFLRQLYAWGPDIMVKIGTPGPSKVPGFYLMPVDITVNGQTDMGEVYVSKDGKTLLQGEVFDTTGDPFAENRSKIHLDNSPSKGPADAPVTLVEFADFQCPHCRELYEELKNIEMQYPQVRVVYKDYPLNSIHPWADTAAVGGRCAYVQSPDAFWKVHDLIFDNQDVISSENVWDKLVSFAAQSGLDQDAFKACLSSPDAQKAVDANHADGVALGVNSTPTVYVNGRPVVGGNTSIITRDIDYELAQKKAAGN